MPTPLRALIPKLQRCYPFVLGREEGVVAILVGLMAGKAEVKYRPGLTSPEKVADLIRDLGFGADVQERGEKSGEVELVVSFYQL